MARLPKGSLPLRVLTIGFAVFALPLMIYFLVFYWMDNQRDMDRLLLSLREVGRGRAEILERLHQDSLRAIGIIEALWVSDPDGLEQIVKGVAEGGGLVNAFYITIEGDRYIVTASFDSSMMGEDLSGYYPLKEAREVGEVSVLGLSTEKFAKFLYVAKLVKWGEGFLVVVRDISNALKTLLASPSLGYFVRCSVIASDGIVYASGDPELLLQEIDPGSPGIDFAVKPLKGVEGGYLIDVDGVERIAIEFPIAGTDFAILVDVDRSELFAYQTARLLHFVLIFFALIAIGGGIALYLTQKMAVPLRHLREVMSAVSQGNLSARFEPKPMGFEINQVGLIFNETCESLSQYMAKASAEKVQRETLQKELDIGQEIQKSILPHTKPTAPGLDIGARYLPSKQVGGDFYDVFVQPLNGQDVVLTVADASGKGISACLYAFCLRSMLRAYTTREDQLSRIVREANNIFCEDTANTGMFVTAFSALYHPDSKRLTYSSNGHNPAFLRKAGGEIVELQGTGIALGIQRLKEVEVGEVTLESGDILLLYTDGVTEAHNAKLELYGEERLLAFLQQEEPEDAEAIADRLVGEVEAFCGEHPQHDDITIMVVRVL